MPPRGFSPSVLALTLLACAPAGSPAETFDAVGETTDGSRDRSATPPDVAPALDAEAADSGGAAVDSVRPDSNPAADRVESDRADGASTSDIGAVADTSPVDAGGPPPDTGVPDARPGRDRPADDEAPRVCIDNPAEGARVFGEIALWGWATDSSGVTSIEIMVGDQLLSDGSYTYGSARPDVCAAHGDLGDPSCPAVGWTGSLDTTHYPDGEITLTLIARDALGGEALVQRRFTVDNEDDPLSRPTVGVQRWDMYAGDRTWTQQQELGYRPGGAAFLRPAEWHHRAPFFCRRTADVSWVQHPSDAGPLWFNDPFSSSRVQEAMNQEILFAANAGIDYFIFNGPTLTLASNGWDLHHNLDAYLASPHRGRIDFVMALYGHEAMNYGRTRVNRMMDEIVGHMQQPEWHTVMGGRPLLPVLWPLNFKQQLEENAQTAERMTFAGFVAHVRQRVTSAGLLDPYIVGQEITHGYRAADVLSVAGFDAVSEYSAGYGGATALRDEGPTYQQATRSLLTIYEDRFLGTMPFVPPMSYQYYQWPRASSDRYHHYQLAEPGDIADRFRRVFDYVRDHPVACEAETIFVYSWNEHSEGGGLCPTMGAAPNYAPVTAELDEVAGVLADYTY